MTSIGERLATARRDADMTLDDVLMAIRNELPRSMWISRATISRSEKATQVDPFVVAVLADIYKVDFRSTFPEAHADLNSVRDLLIRQSGWLRGSAVETAA